MSILCITFYKWNQRPRLYFNNIQNGGHLKAFDVENNLYAGLKYFKFKFVKHNYRSIWWREETILKFNWKIATNVWTSKPDWCYSKDFFLDKSATIEYVYRNINENNILKKAETYGALVAPEYRVSRITSMVYAVRGSRNMFLPRWQINDIRETQTFILLWTHYS